jgi:hypothetical protein
VPASVKAVLASRVREESPARATASAVAEGTREGELDQRKPSVVALVDKPRTWRLGARLGAVAGRADVAGAVGGELETCTGGDLAGPQSCLARRLRQRGLPTFRLEPAQGEVAES